MAQRSVPDITRIIQEPDIMVGKPVVRGTRIPVELVLETLAYEFDLDEQFAACPRLTLGDVKAVLAFAQASVESDYRRSRRKSADAAAAEA